MRAADEKLVIRHGTLEVGIAPLLGAGLDRFDYVADGHRQPIFVAPPQSGRRRSGLDLSMFVLLPFSNRVSGGGFWFDGRFFSLQPNVDREPHPIHGDAFSQKWDVIEATAASATLRLVSNSRSVFKYGAVLHYALTEGVLSMRLAVENRGNLSLPFGTGFHPFIVRTRDLTLQASAAAVWLEDENHLRDGIAPVALPPLWDFTRPRPLPSNFVNNAFAGWSRQAKISWPDRRLELSIEASEALSTFVLYSPSSESSFFCFEPVSHPVDAFNLPGNPTANGLTVLAPGEQSEVWARFAVRAT